MFSEKKEEGKDGDDVTLLDDHAKAQSGGKLASPSVITFGIRI